MQDPRPLSMKEEDMFEMGNGRLGHRGQEPRVARGTTSHFHRRIALQAVAKIESVPCTVIKDSSVIIPLIQTRRYRVPKIAPLVRQERRQALLEATWRCAGRKGFSDLTVDEICAEAGISKGGFYGYFDTKQDLLLALLEDDAAQLEAVAEELDVAQLQGVERLRRFTRAMLQRGENQARRQVRADLWAAASTDEAVQERLSLAVASKRARLRRWVEAAVREGELTQVPANAFASILLALGDGLLMHAGTDPAAFRWQNIRRALDVLLEGISAD